MKNPIILSLFAAVLLAFNVQAQDKLSWKKHVKLADELYAKAQYADAGDGLEAPVLEREAGGIAGDIPAQRRHVRRHRATKARQRVVEAHDRVIPGRFKEHLETITDAWMQRHAVGETVAITATTDEHVDAINQSIRQR